MKKKIILLLCIIMLMGMTLQVNANERTVGNLTDCTISIGNASNGIRVAFTTDSTTTADEIGCKDIVLQEKVNGGWRDIDINGGYAEKFIVLRSQRSLHRSSRGENISGILHPLREIREHDKNAV